MEKHAARPPARKRSARRSIYPPACKPYGLEADTESYGPEGGAIEGNAADDSLMVDQAHFPVLDMPLPA